MSPSPTRPSTLGTTDTLMLTAVFAGVVGSLILWAEAAKVAGAIALISRAGDLRPSLAHPQVTELGHRLGSARGVDCYASIEDSLVLLGPPRSGKGVHIVINAILDAPGAVIPPSPRPDNLTAALQARAKLGPVAVFDPQRLAPGIPSATWGSPIRGCENPQQP